MNAGETGREGGRPPDERDTAAMASALIGVVGAAGAPQEVISDLLGLFSLVRKDDRLKSPGGACSIWIDRREIGHSRSLADGTVVNEALVESAEEAHRCAAALYVAIRAAAKTPDMPEKPAGWDEMTTQFHAEARLRAEEIRIVDGDHARGRVH